MGLSPRIGVDSIPPPYPTHIGGLGWMDRVSFGIQVRINKFIFNWIELNKGVYRCYWAGIFITVRIIIPIIISDSSPPSSSSSSSPKVDRLGPLRVVIVINTTTIIRTIVITITVGAMTIKLILVIVIITIIIIVVIIIITIIIIITLMLLSS